MLLKALGYLCLILPSYALAVENNPMTKEVLQRELEEFNFYSYGPASFATVCLSDSCFSAHAGHKNIDQKEAVQADSLLRVGSNSKFVTAVLILKLVDQGYLNLDDLLIDYFPEYSKWEGVTVRHLLNHSSGVPPYVFSQRGLVKGILSVFNWRTRIWKPYEIIDSVAHIPSVFPTGSKVEYNNTNFVLLGMIAEKATRIPMEVLLDREIFAPLAMNDSYLRILDSQEDRRVDGYFPVELPLPSWFINLLSRKLEVKGPYIETTNAYDPSMAWASGAIVSTTEDLAKLVKALFDGKLISPSLLKEMKVMRSGTTLGFPVEYGLGLMKTPTEHGDGFGHGGLAPGYQVATNYLENLDLTLVVGQNMGPGQVYSLFHNLLDQAVYGSRGQHLPLAPESLPGELARDSIHLRIKGQLNKAVLGFELYPKTVGYSVQRHKLWSPKLEYPYSSFQVQLTKVRDQEYLVLRASSGDFLFASETKVGASVPFLEVFVKNDGLHQLSAARNGQSLRGDKFSVYSGVRTFTEAGIEICIAKVLDANRQIHVQLGSNGKTRLNLQDNLKFAGNIPLRKAKKKDLAISFYGSNTTICSSN